MKMCWKWGLCIELTYMRDYHHAHSIWWNLMSFDESGGNWIQHVSFEKPSLPKFISPTSMSSAAGCHQISTDILVCSLLLSLQEPDAPRNSDWNHTSHTWWVRRSHHYIAATIPSDSRHYGSRCYITAVIVIAMAAIWVIVITTVMTITPVIAAPQTYPAWTHHLHASSSSR